MSKTDIIYKDVNSITNNIRSSLMDAYDQGKIDGYKQGVSDERKRIVGELEEQLKDEALGDGKSVSDVGIGLEIALKMVRGREND